MYFLPASQVPLRGFLQRGAYTKGRTPVIEVATP
jgi:hypothetical protein